ncbi:unnamed protein product, partial [Polarella glacialis]
LCIVARGVEEFSLLSIVIRTGRTHQIRVHMKHIGHPTVTDGKYTDPAVFSSDRSWCPRNFLHRHRLCFQDTEGLLREAVAPLPEDLRCVFAALRPVPGVPEGADERSAAAWQRLLDGWVPSESRSWSDAVSSEEGRRATTTATTATTTPTTARTTTTTTSEEGRTTAQERKEP